MKKKKQVNITAYIEQELVAMIDDNVIEDFVLCVRFKDDRGSHYITTSTEDAGTELVCAEHCRNRVRNDIGSL